MLLTSWRMRAVAFSFFIAAVLLLCSHAISPEGTEEPEVYSFPYPSNQEHIQFFESFQASNKVGVSDVAELDWVLSTADAYLSQKPIISSSHSVYHGDNSLILSKPHVRYGLSKKIEKPLSLDNDFITIQFEVKFKKPLSCSGAYLKFVALPDDTATAANELDQSQFDEKTPYVLMFGPDKCGSTSKVHVIFRHQNPITKVFEEKHMSESVKFPNDDVSHLYTLQIKKSDQSVRLLIDREEKVLAFVKEIDNFKPNFFAERFVSDKNDIKPEDWDDNEEIFDESATQPNDWETEEFVIDESASKPEDWDEDEDGVYEKPLVKNPNFKGEWKQPKIKNPNFKGKWKAKEIENSEYFEQDFPLSSLPKLAFVFVEVLSNDENISFDNILISTDFETGKELAEKVFIPKQEKEKAELFENNLKSKKEARDKNLEENFGAFSIIEYGFGEVLDFVQKHQIIMLPLITVSVILIVFVAFTRCKRLLSDEEVEQVLSEAELEIKQKEAVHKKNEDEAKEEDDISEAELEEIKENETAASVEKKETGEEKEVVRRRPKRAD